MRCEMNLWTQLAWTAQYLETPGLTLCVCEAMALEGRMRFLSNAISNCKWQYLWEENQCIKRYRQRVASSSNKSESITKVHMYIYNKVIRTLPIPYEIVYASRWNSYTPSMPCSSGASARSIWSTCPLSRPRHLQYIWVKYMWARYIGSAHMGPIHACNPSARYRGIYSGFEFGGDSVPATATGKSFCFARAMHTWIWTRVQAQE